VRDVVAPSRLAVTVLPGHAVLGRLAFAQVRSHSELREVHVTEPEGAQRDAGVARHQLERTAPSLTVEGLAHRGQRTDRSRVGTRIAQPVGDCLESHSHTRRAEVQRRVVEAIDPPRQRPPTRSRRARPPLVTGVAVGLQQGQHHPSRT